MAQCQSALHALHLIYAVTNDHCLVPSAREKLLLCANASSAGTLQAVSPATHHHRLPANPPPTPPSTKQGSGFRLGTAARRTDIKCEPALGFSPSCFSSAFESSRFSVQNHVPDTASSPTTEISHHEDGLLRRFSQTTLERHASKAKKRGGSLFGFLSVKEPSTHALEQFAEYQRKQEPTGVKMPVTAPRVSSKWDALPLEQHKVEGFTQHGSHHASTPNGTRRQAHNSNNNTATPRSPSSSSPHALRAPNPALSPTATQSHPAPTSSATPTQQASKSGHLPPTTITSSTTRQKNAPPFLPAAQNLAAIAPWAEPPSPDARPPRPRRTTATDAALPPEVYFPETSEAFLVSGAQAAGLGRGNDGSSALASPSTSTAVAQKLPPASATATACLRAASGPATPTGPGRTSALGRSSSRSTTTGTASTTSTTTKVEMSSTQRPDEKKRKGRFGKLAGKR